MYLNRFSTALLFGFLFFSLTSVWAQSTDRPAIPQSTDRAAVLREIESLRSQLKSREDAFLEPDLEDRTAFAEALQQRGQGLIRLLPREVYDANNKLTIRGGGAYYSFTRLTHEYGNGSDIELQMGNLTVGFAGANYGLLANLGDIPLDNITLDTLGVEWLASYVPATSLPKARIEQRRSGEGMRIENVLYKGTVLSVVNSTYILRSVNYGSSDVLVAFRVVRKDADGSLILAWKILKHYETPQLERQNDNGTG
jgi:hypothetical protein